MQSINRLIDKSKNLSRAFTLVEMLIVVAILAVLMTIVFRLGNLGSADNARTTTVVKMQKIENCLSGYYAAFGSYPPVKVHGWRDIYHRVGDEGDQEEETNESLNWRQIHAACASQPFGCEYPPSRSTADGKSEEQIIEDWAKEVGNRVGNSSEYPKYSNNPNWPFSDLPWTNLKGPDINGGFSGEAWYNPDWKAIKLFKFGVMSFLLPRYLFMMGGDGEFIGKTGDPCAQWGDNNDLPCNPLEGKQYDDWSKVIYFAQYEKKEKDREPSDLAKVANIPSQAVCARWMSNLEGICSTLKPMTFFGIKVGNGEGLSAGSEGEDGEIYPPAPCTHYPSSGSSGTPYRNATVTISDGWGREFYYYSPAPYQSYTLWSAGKNGYTFPPWMDRKDYNDRQVSGTWNSSKQRPCTVAEMVADDMMQMSH